MSELELGLRIYNLIDLVDDDDGHGLARLTINGVDFHVELIEIVACKTCMGDSPAQHWCADTYAVSPDREKQLQEIYSAWGGEGPWSAIEADGRQFIVLILPHCT